MKLMVTGATGFLGSQLVKRLLEKNDEVIILKRSFSDVSRLNQILKCLTVYDIDRCKLQIPFEENPDLNGIIHTATCYGRKKESMVTLFSANTYFPLQLLELAAEYHVPFFINSDTVLNRRTNDYALAKKQFLDWGRKFSEAEKIHFVNIKLEQFYGPGDGATKFTEYVIQSCLDNVASLDLTLGEQKRDFIYIDDVIAAYGLLIEQAAIRPAWYHEYELGSGNPVKIRDFVSLAKRLTKAKTILNFGALPQRPNEKLELQPTLRALRKLGWQCQVGLTEGIKRIITSKKGNREG
jgi:CDP-paratose synthetase